MITEICALLTDISTESARVKAVGTREECEGARTSDADCMAIVDCDAPKVGTRVWISRERDGSIHVDGPVRLLIR